MMSRQEAIELLELVHFEGRGAKLRQLGNGQWVVILDRPNCYHLWCPEDLNKAIAELESVQQRASVAGKA